MSVDRRYITKEYIVYDDVLVSEHRFCDICDEEITGHYWHVDTHHNDWGNDSVDSFEEFDVCSAECLNKKFKEYIENSNDKWNTCEIEVEHFRGPRVKGDIEH